MYTNFNHFFTVRTKNVWHIKVQLSPLSHHLYSVITLHNKTHTTDVWHRCISGMWHFKVYSKQFSRYSVHAYSLTVMPFVYHGRKFDTVELLMPEIITKWQKWSHSFIDSSINEWCRGLECVVKNDCGLIEHCSLAWITAFIKQYYYFRLLMDH